MHGSLRPRLLALALAATTVLPLAPAQAFEVYGAWHCGNDYCTWSAPREKDGVLNPEFDTRNHWLIDRGDGSGLPSVNLVVLSFVSPLKLLNGTTDSGTLNGVPRGMTPAVVKYFTDRQVRVALSIGGITYTDAWNQALAANPQLLAAKAVDLAKRLGVDIEIDYEENRKPNLAGLEAFIREYRRLIPFDPNGTGPRLTIDLAAGDRWLIAITQKATADWLRDTSPAAVRLDYANAMVPSRQPQTAEAIANWQEHVDGKSQYAPPIPPLAPARFTGSVYLVGSKPIAECRSFASSLQNTTSAFVKGVSGKQAGMSPGLLGYMFWAAECSGTRSVCTAPPNSCEGGTGAGAKALGVPVPMPPLTRN